MTQELITIEEIIKLNSERTQGTWQYKTEGKPDYQYISRDGIQQLDDTIIFDDGIYPIDPKDLEFIAAAPRIAAKAIDLDEICQDQHKRLGIITRDMNGWAKSFAEEKRKTTELDNIVNRLRKSNDDLVKENRELQKLVYDLQQTNQTLLKRLGA
jgi:hypothetical protein